MAPRGLSAEEKRVKLLEIFHETKDFYQLKELEKLGPKMKGIVSQSVKDVLQSLVDDGLVQTDKVGSSNFFWSFPSQHGATIQNRWKTAEDARDTHRARLTDLQAMVEAEKESRPESESRDRALTELASLENEIVRLEEELANYGACDPVKLKEHQRAVVLSKEAAVRWTDNYLVLMSYFTRERGVDPADVRNYLGVDEDYEDLVVD